MDSQIRPKQLDPNTPITLGPKRTENGRDDRVHKSKNSKPEEGLIERDRPSISSEDILAAPETTLATTPEIPFSPVSVPESAEEVIPPEPDEFNIPDNDHLSDPYDEASYTVPPTAPAPYGGTMSTPFFENVYLDRSTEDGEDALEESSPVSTLPTEPQAPEAAPISVEGDEYPEPRPESLGHAETRPGENPPADAVSTKNMPPKDTPPQPPEEKTTKSQPDDSRSDRPRRKTLFWLVTPIAILLFIGIFLSFSVPGIASLFSTVFYGFTILVFFLFIMLGVFVVFGFREQAGKLLQIFFEGGIKYIDIAQFFSDFWDEILRMLQEFVLWISPFIAVALAFIFYYIVMYVFRYVATLGDVTVFTIIMTIILASFTAGLSLSNFGQGEEDSYSFRSQISFRFGRVFVDSVEIAVALIFLTIDLSRPFFLPETLHGPVSAEGFGIDLMMRGVEPEGFSTTLRIAGFAVLVEIVRKIYRLVASMVLRYNELKKHVEKQGGPIETADEMFELLRRSSRIAFKDNLDDMTKFLGFTTVLIGVFFFFPRLKLVSLLFFNLSNLVWDIIVPSRAIKPVKSEDLFSRMIARTFKL